MPQLFRFYDPCFRGMPGAAVPPPPAAIAVANRLNGKTLAARDAVRAVRLALPKRVFGVVFRKGYLALHYVPADGGYPQHCWRVLRAEAVPGQQ